VAKKPVTREQPRLTTLTIVATGFKIVETTSLEMERASLRYLQAKLALLRQLERRGSPYITAAENAVKAALDRVWMAQRR